MQRHLSLLLLVVIAFSTAFFTHYQRPERSGPRAAKIISNIRSSSSSSCRLSLGGDNNALNREMDTFFERAAESGAKSVRSLTAQERAMRAIRGGEIEDEIFDVRADLLQLEDDLFAGRAGVTSADVQAVRDKLNALKKEYMDVVGANDLPLYFGKVPDSMQ